MKPAIFVAKLSFAALIAMAGTASAKDICMPTAELEASLIDWYGEYPVEGTTTRTTEVWASDVTGTWTLVQYLVDGQSCVLAQGNDWGSELSDDLVVAEVTQ